MKASIIVVCLLFFATNVVLAYAPDVNFWQKRQVQTQLAALPQPQSALSSLSTLANVPSAIPQDLSNALSMSRLRKWAQGPDHPQLEALLNALSNQYGSVRDVALPSSGNSDRTILHVQDVHMNPEAQKNISRVLQRLFNADIVDLVALEGAFSPLDLATIRKFPNKNSVHKVGDYLLREHKISGPIHAAFTSPATIPPVVGIDDKQHYNANVNAVRQSFPLKKKCKKRLEIVERELLDQKLKTFSPELTAFEAAVHAYRKGEMSMGDYVQLLAQNVPDVSLDVETFLQTIKLETEMNMAQVEHERAILIKELIRSLSDNQTQALAGMSHAFRMGQLNHADFYSYLRDLCDGAGVNFSRFQEMMQYIQYVLLAESIDGAALSHELAEVESQIFNSLAKTEKEKGLISDVRWTYLVGKLIDFSLTVEEWGEYRSLPSVQAAKLPRKTLASFEKFYEEAELRDRKMAVNLQHAMKEMDAKVAVLVTGGFHTAGIKALSHNAGFTVVTYTPKITEMVSSSAPAPLSVFTQEKTPLEELFKGKRLFLAPMPTPAIPAVNKLVILASKEGPHATQKFGRWAWHMLSTPKEIEKVWVTRAHGIQQKLVHAALFFKKKFRAVDIGISVLFVGLFLWNVTGLSSSDLFMWLFLLTPLGFMYGVRDAQKDRSKARKIVALLRKNKDLEKLRIIHGTYIEDFSVEGIPYALTKIVNKEYIEEVDPQVTVIRIPKKTSELEELIRIFLINFSEYYGHRMGLTGQIDVEGKEFILRAYDKTKPLPKLSLKKQMPRPPSVVEEEDPVTFATRHGNKKTVVQNNEPKTLRQQAEAVVEAMLKEREGIGTFLRIQVNSDAPRTIRSDIIEDAAKLGILVRVDKNIQTSKYFDIHVNINKAGAIEFVNGFLEWLDTPPYGKPVFKKTQAPPLKYLKRILELHKHYGWLPILLLILGVSLFGVHGIISLGSDVWASMRGGMFWMMASMGFMPGMAAYLEKLKARREFARENEERWGDLEPDDAQLLSWRFIDQFSQTVVAKLLGISQVAVSLREKKVLERLRMLVNNEVPSKNKQGPVEIDFDNPSGLAGLDEQDKYVLERKFFAHKSTLQVADELGVSDTTVYNRQARALKNLAALKLVRKNIGKLKHLNERDRDTLERRYLRGQHADEIAREIGITSVAVLTRQRRALRNLKDLIAGKNQESIRLVRKSKGNALKKLRDYEREVLVRRILVGETALEISHDLKVSAGTILNWEKNALEILRKIRGEQRGAMAEPPWRTLKNEENMERVHENAAVLVDLNDRDRNVLNRHYVVGKTVREMADEDDISEARVLHRIRRAVKNFNDLLEGKNQEAIRMMRENKGNFLEKLRDIDREVLVRHILWGQTREEISADLSKPVGTVANSLRRGIRVLKSVDPLAVVAIIGAFGYFVLPGLGALNFEVVWVAFQDTVFTMGLPTEALAKVGNGAWTGIGMALSGLMVGMGLLQTGQNRDNDAPHLLEKIMTGDLRPEGVTPTQLRTLGDWYRNYPIPEQVVAFVAAAVDPYAGRKYISDKINNDAVEVLIELFSSLSVLERQRMGNLLEDWATGPEIPPSFEWMQTPVLDHFHVLVNSLRGINKPPGKNVLIKLHPKALSSSSRSDRDASIPQEELDPLINQERLNPKMAIEIRPGRFVVDDQMGQSVESLAIQADEIMEIYRSADADMEGAIKKLNSFATGMRLYGQVEVLHNSLNPHQNESLMMPLSFIVWKIMNNVYSLEEIERNMRILFQSNNILVPESRANELETWNHLERRRMWAQWKREKPEIINKLVSAYDDILEGGRKVRVYNTPLYWPILKYFSNKKQFFWPFSKPLENLTEMHLLGHRYENPERGAMEFWIKAMEWMGEDDQSQLNWTSVLAKTVLERVMGRAKYRDRILFKRLTKAIEIIKGINALAEVEGQRDIRGVKSESAATGSIFTLMEKRQVTDADPEEKISQFKGLNSSRSGSAVHRLLERYRHMPLEGKVILWLSTMAILPVIEKWSMAIDHIHPLVWIQVVSPISFILISFVGFYLKGLQNQLRTFRTFPWYHKVGTLVLNGLYAGFLSDMIFLFAISTILPVQVFESLGFLSFIFVLLFSQIFLGWILGKHRHKSNRTTLIGVALILLSVGVNIYGQGAAQKTSVFGGALLVGLMAPGIWLALISPILAAAREVYNRHIIEKYHSGNPDIKNLLVQIQYSVGMLTITSITIGLAFLPGVNGPPITQYLSLIQDWKPYVAAALLTITLLVVYDLHSSPKINMPLMAFLKGFGPPLTGFFALLMLYQPMTIWDGLAALLILSAFAIQFIGRKTEPVSSLEEKVLSELKKGDVHSVQELRDILKIEDPALFGAVRAIGEKKRIRFTFIDTNGEEHPRHKGFYLEMSPETGRKTGRLVSFPHLIVNGNWISVAYMILTTPSGRVLFQERIGDGKGLYDWSAGGHVEPGHTPLDTAVNEAYEELPLKKVGIEIDRNHVQQIIFENKSFLQMRETKHHKGPPGVVDGVLQVWHEFEKKNLLAHYFTMQVSEDNMDSLIRAANDEKLEHDEVAGVKTIHIGELKEKLNQTTDKFTAGVYVMNDQVERLEKLILSDSGSILDDYSHLTKEMAEKFSKHVQYGTALGKPGSGKGTLLNRFVAELNAVLSSDNQYVILTMGDIFRAVSETVKAGKEHRPIDMGKVGIFKDLTIPDEAVQRMESGKMLSDDLAVDILNEVLKLEPYRSAHGIFFDGFPRSQPQLIMASEGKVFRNGKPVTIDFNFILDIDDDTVVRRSEIRRNQEIQRAEAEGRDPEIRRDDNPESVKIRIKEYQDITGPAVEASRHISKTIELKGEFPVGFIHHSSLKEADHVYGNFLVKLEKWLLEKKGMPVSSFSIFRIIILSFMYGTLIPAQFAFSQTLRDFEDEFDLDQGTGPQTNHIVHAFLLTLLALIPLIVLSYFILSFVLSRFSIRHVMGNIGPEDDSFSFSATLLLIGYGATVIIVGTISNSWMMGPINIAYNILWLITFVVAYFLYKFARLDYTNSWVTKAFVVGSIVVAALLTNILTQGWSPIELSTHLYGGIVSIVVMGILLVMVMAYSAVSLSQKKTNDIDDAPRAKKSRRRQKGFSSIETVGAMTVLSGAFGYFILPELAALNVDARLAGWAIHGMALGGGLMGGVTQSRSSAPSGHHGENVHYRTISNDLGAKPLELGVGDTFQDVIQNDPKLTGNRVNIVFVDESLTPKLDDLVQGLHPDREILLIAQTTALTDALIQRKMGRDNITVIDAQTRGYFSQDQFKLIQIESHPRALGK
jgi:DNA-directed RNA polymerase specialized sigma24 family protein/adenylate kinase family enzyme/8-oxo-dGTP pyrophosphatase MutT (NUDIX family)